MSKRREIVGRLTPDVNFGITYSGARVASYPIVLSLVLLVYVASRYDDSEVSSSLQPLDHLRHLYVL